MTDSRVVCHAVFRIHIGFNADLDPDPAFYPSADQDMEPGSQTNADLDPGRLFHHKKLDFDLKNILKVANMSKHTTVPMKVQKAFHKAGNQVYLLILVNFLAPGSGPDPNSQYRTVRTKLDRIIADPDLKYWCYVYRLANIVITILNSRKLTSDLGGRMLCQHSQQGGLPCTIPLANRWQNIFVKYRR